MRYCALMRCYQSFPTAIPLYEAGYPRVTHPSATKLFKNLPKLHQRITPFDLHVLGTPPAFILSQDRTLTLICDEIHSNFLRLKSLRDFEFNPVQSYTDLIRIILLHCYFHNSLMVAKPSKIYFWFLFF